MEVSALKSEIIDLIEKAKDYLGKIVITPINREDDLLLSRYLDEKLKSRKRTLL